MAPDYSEVLEARASQSTPGVPTQNQIAAFLRESAHGAVVLTELLDSPSWNIFRSNLGGDLQACEAERTLLRDRIEGGGLVGDERARADLRLQYLRGAIDKLTRALDLPKQLIAQHDAMEKVARGTLPADAPPPSVAAPAPPKPRRKRKTS